MIHSKPTEGSRRWAAALASALLVATAVIAGPAQDRVSSAVRKLANGDPVTLPARALEALTAHADVE